MSIFSRFILRTASDRFEEMRRVLAVPEDKVADEEATTSDSATSPACKPETAESVTPQLPLMAPLTPVRVGVAAKKPVKPDSAPPLKYSTYLIDPSEADPIIPLLISGNEPAKLQTPHEYLKSLGKHSDSAAPSHKYTPPEYLEGFGTYLDDGTPYYGDFSYNELNGLPEASQRKIMKRIFFDPDVPLDTAELHVAMRFETHLDHSGQWVHGEEI